MVGTTKNVNLMLSLAMDILVEGKACDCKKFKIIQLIRQGKVVNWNDKQPLEWNHFKLSLKEDQGADVRKGRSHNDSSWRIDSGWLPKSQPWYGEPWLSSTPFGEEGSLTDPSQYIDAPVLLTHNQAYEFYTCIQGERTNGETYWLGCLHWGFAYTEVGIPGKNVRDPIPPIATLFPFEVKCGTDPVVKKALDHAISTWNSVEPKKVIQPGGKPSK